LSFFDLDVGKEILLRKADKPVAKK